jgi:hypothetical protein
MVEVIANNIIGSVQLGVIYFPFLGYFDSFDKSCSKVSYEIGIANLNT